MAVHRCAPGPTGEERGVEGQARVLGGADFGTPKRKPATCASVPSTPLDSKAMRRIAAPAHYEVFKQAHPARAASIPMTVEARLSLARKLICALVAECSGMSLSWAWKLCEDIEVSHCWLTEAERIDRVLGRLPRAIRAATLALLNAPLRV
jgi:hypothetical protein